jgi:hypothetical protein
MLHVTYANSVLVMSADSPHDGSLVRPLRLRLAGALRKYSAGRQPWREAIRRKRPCWSGETDRALATVETAA